LERMSCPLMLLDDRAEAEEIAAQLARNHRVTVRILVDRDPRLPVTASPGKRCRRRTPIGVTRRHPG
jgi:hypothetical protein